MRALPMLVLGSLLLAGCTDGGSSPDDAEADALADKDFGVEATATTGIIRGYVVDEAIRPIIDVAVSILSVNETVTTKEDGAFAFDDLEPGTYFLQSAKKGFASIQTSVDVVAGDSEPPLVKISLVAIPSEQPFVDTFHFSGYLTFGVAVFATSVGTTVYGPIADQFNDQSIWTLTFTQLPMWAQGELVWDQTQPAGGQFIWEMTDTSNNPAGYRETTTSPALAYWNTTVIIEHNETTLDPDRGIAYRFFGGPHPLCMEPENDVMPFRTFGCGVTFQQKAEAYIHNFYNFAPAEGWRFTVDGPPIVPS